MRLASLTALIGLCLAIGVPDLAAQKEKNKKPSNQGNTFGPNKNKTLTTGKAVEKFTVKANETVSVDFRFESSLENAIIIYDRNMNQIALRGNRKHGQSRVVLKGGQRDHVYTITAWHKKDAANNKGRWVQSLKKVSRTNAHTTRIGWEDAVDKDFNDAVAIVRHHRFGPDKNLPLQIDKISEKITVRSGETAHLTFNFGMAAWPNAVIVYDDQMKQVAIRGNFRYGKEALTLKGGKQARTYYITGWHKDGPPSGKLPWRVSVKKKVTKRGGDLHVGYEDGGDNNFRDASVVVRFKRKP